MTRSSHPDDLRRIWVSAPAPGSSGPDYTLLADRGGAYAGRARAGEPVLVIQLSETPIGGVGRRAAGCELLPHASLRFAIARREWDGPAAALICTDPDLVDAFAVLAADVESRIDPTATKWADVLAVVEEWQSLIAPRGAPSTEHEVGLWGELWMLAHADDPDRILASWRGPDREAADFHLDGRALEIKTSRRRGEHHVSQKQLVSPMGDAEAWLLSMWVGVDPIRGVTATELADLLRSRVSDPVEALRRLGAAGYTLADRNLYQTKLVLLATPSWYRVEDVPRVRAADLGISRLRYVVSLDEAAAADAGVASSLWHHFLGRDYGGTT